MRAPNPPPSRPERLAHALVERLGLLGRRGVHEARAVALARVAVERELAHAEQLAAGVATDRFMLAVVVLEDPQREQLGSEPVGLARSVAAAHAEQHEQAAADARNLLAVDRDRRLADPLHQRAHAAYSARRGGGRRGRRVSWAASPARRPPARARRVGPHGARRAGGRRAARRVPCASPTACSAPRRSRSTRRTSSTPGCSCGGTARRAWCASAARARATSGCTPTIPVAPSTSARVDRLLGLVVEGAIAGGARPAALGRRWSRSAEGAVVRRGPGAGSRPARRGGGPRCVRPVFSSERPRQKCA